MTGRVESRSHAELRGEFRLPALYLNIEDWMGFARRKSVRLPQHWSTEFHAIRWPPGPGGEDPACSDGIGAAAALDAGSAA